MTNTRDLVLRAYRAELTRLRALSPDLFVDELEEAAPIWTPVTISFSIT